METKEPYERTMVALASELPSAVYDHASAVIRAHVAAQDAMNAELKQTINEMVDNLNRTMRHYQDAVAEREALKARIEGAPTVWALCKDGVPIDCRYGPEHYASPERMDPGYVVTRIHAVPVEKEEP